MKKLLLGLFLFLLGAGSTYVVMRFQVSPAVQHNSGLVPVTVMRRDIDATVLATGIIKPMVGAEVRVGSRISGVVLKLHVGVGDFVKKGQLLAELDTVELAARLDQTEAALRLARAELDFAKVELGRKRNLAERNLISQEELEAAEKVARVAEIRVEEARANLVYSQTQLDHTLIHAPIDGVVASVSTQEGETIAASFATPTFLTIIDLNRLELWAYVDETDIGRVGEGQTAHFTVDTYPDAEFSGEVLSVHPNAVIQNTVVNYVAIVSIGDRQGKILRPEMTTNVTILIQSRKNVLSIPRRAIRRDQGKYLVLVQGEEQMEEREVQVGWRDRSYTEIVAGLSEGEIVLIGEP